MRRNPLHVTRERYARALRTCLKALEAIGIEQVNSDAARPVHTARDLGITDTRELLQAPLNQQDPLIGLLAKRVQLMNAINRHLAQVEALPPER